MAINIQTEEANQLWIQRKKNSDEKLCIYINDGVSSERHQQTTKPGREFEGTLSKPRNSQDWSTAKISYGKEIQSSEHFKNSKSTPFCEKKQVFITDGSTEEAFEDGSQDGFWDTLLRGSKAAVQKAGDRHTAIFGRFLGLLEDRCECGTRCVGWFLMETAYATTFCSLTDCCSYRNALVPSATRSTEKVR